MISGKGKEQLVQEICSFFRRKLTDSNHIKSYYRASLSEALKLLADRKWRHTPLQEKQKILGTLEVLAHWYRSVYKGMKVKAQGKEWTVVGKAKAKVRLSGEDAQIEEMDESAVEAIQLAGIQGIVEHSEVARAILGSYEEKPEGADSLVLMLLLKIAGRLNWRKTDEGHAS